MPTHTLAVFSDLHGVPWIKSEDKRKSWLARGVPDDRRKNPLSGALSLIREREMKAVALICPGDMGNEANPDGIELGWTAINRLADALEVAAVAATPGNHDLDSRYISNDHDARAVLQALNPTFPLTDAIRRDHFWANHFALWTTGTLRLLTVNTSAYHGGARAEIDHGRITDATLQSIREALTADTTQPFNVCVCHHHPQPNSSMEPEDRESTVGGDQLLALLGSGAFGRWLVIHGHRHHPLVQYAPGGAGAAVVFSAGSFSVKLYSKVNTRVHNQFYVIDLFDNPAPGVSLGGRFSSWDWAYGEGWSPSPGRELPAYGGFGFRGDLATLAESIATAAGTDFQPWSTIEAAVPAVQFLLPADLDRIAELLRNSHDKDILFTKDHRPAQVGRRS